MSLVPPKMTVFSANERDLGITGGGGSNFCTVAGNMTVVIMVCRILVELFFMWRNSRLGCRRNKAVAPRTDTG